MKNSLHIVLAFLVLLSSTGLVINTHICKGERKSMALYTNAKNCKQQAAVPKACPMHGDTMPQMADDMEMKDCCENESDLMKIDLEQQAQYFSLDLLFSQLDLSTSLSSTNIELPLPQFTKAQYLNFKPPLLVCDLRLSLQTFRC